MIRPGGLALHEVRRGLVRGRTSDPDFFHFPGTSAAIAHQTACIKYKAPDGRFWVSKCHSHVDPDSLVITFRFEHWRRGAENGPADFSAEELKFLDWNGRPWIARVNPMDLPGTPEFVLRPTA